MQDIRLPDGTWVTTAIWVGVGPAPPQCETCNWRDDGPMGAGEDDSLRVQFQRCARCGWCRGRYLDNPHPEADDAQ